jgi:hypothetical protein
MPPRRRGMLDVLFAAVAAIAADSARKRGREVSLEARALRDTMRSQERSHARSEREKDRLSRIAAQIREVCARPFPPPDRFAAWPDVELRRLARVVYLFKQLRSRVEGLKAEASLELLGTGGAELVARIEKAVEPWMRHPDVLREISALRDDDRLQGQKGDSRRKAIPKAVQREVWVRDAGQCVQCGSKRALEFDHLIPLSEGGSDTVRNLQLLCQACNRRKHKRIG